jgi:hypothetical protein
MLIAPPQLSWVENMLRKEKTEIWLRSLKPSQTSPRISMQYGKWNGPEDGVMPCPLVDGTIKITHILQTQNSCLVVSIEQHDKGVGLLGF